MFEFRAKPKTVLSQKQPNSKKEPLQTHKPLLLEKNYILEQEKLIKADFLKKFSQKTSWSISSAKEPISLWCKNKLKSKNPSQPFFFPDRPISPKSARQKRHIPNG